MSSRSRGPAGGPTGGGDAERDDHGHEPRYESDRNGGRRARPPGTSPQHDGNGVRIAQQPLRARRASVPGQQREDREHVGEIGVARCEGMLDRIQD